MQLTEPYYKFKDLKVYSSTEWLMDNKKKYRQVFDRYKTAYVYAELSLQNKAFDIEDWNAEITLKCFGSRKGVPSEICSMTFTRRISKFDSTSYIREGWGNKKEGSFWKKGAYYWEAWIDGVKIGTKNFYIEDVGKPDNDDSMYVALKSVKLYEGPYEDIPQAQRTYYKTFNYLETRYVYVELALENLLFGKNWECEIFIKFFNGTRELKGEVVRHEKVDKKDQFINTNAGWGSNAKESWRLDNYTMEVVCMDKVLAVVPFKLADHFEEGIAGVLVPSDTQELIPVIDTQEPEESFDDVIKDLDGLIGLTEIKRQVRKHAQYIEFLQLRKEKGFAENEEINIHAVFVGNPGTGKTTVANMMGKLYKKMGLLTKGHVHEVDRVDLIGEYIGQTAPKVKEAIERARGGVLFIDEAYALARSNDDSKDFGREVIEILVKEMSDGEGDMAVIVAGYPKEMEHFINSNPGLKSRFKMFFTFPDYMPQELSLIADYAAKAKNVKFAPAAKNRIDELITEAYRNRDRTFGNARFVYDLIEQGKVNLGLRIMQQENPRTLSEDTFALIELKDVETLDSRLSRLQPKIPIDDALLREALDQLNTLIGIEEIKKSIQELVQLVTFYRETNRNVLNKFYLHTVLVGNPGTGKTTVARILTRIYKALGILERGHMVETDRQGLVAGYIGQTAIKTAEKIDEAAGGVLFIDEAYALSQNGGANGDYGGEAIQTLLKRMEDQRGQFFVFVAGYPENMDTFLKANPGLRSRFDKILKFEDYTAAQLFEIAAQMFHQEDVVLAPDAEAYLKDYLIFLYDYRDKYFGNARTVRTVVTDAVKEQNLRLAALPAKDRTPELLRTVQLQDLQNFRMDKESDLLFIRKSIGFQKKGTPSHG
jgi:SpoVK/Ycf46/Vps4 family AAA+-type ATPase